MALAKFKFSDLNAVCHTCDMCMHSLLLADFKFGDFQIIRQN